MFKLIRLIFIFAALGNAGSKKKEQAADVSEIIMTVPLDSFPEHIEIRGDASYRAISSSLSTDSHQLAKTEFTLPDDPFEVDDNLTLWIKSGTEKQQTQKQKTLIKQLKWVRKLFAQRLPDYFPLELLTRCFTQKFVIRFVGKEFFESLGVPGALAFTVPSGRQIFIRFDIHNFEQELLQLLTDEMQHKLVSDSVRKTCVFFECQHHENSFLNPFLDAKGQLDMQQFKLFKEAVDHQESMLKRIVYLLGKNGYIQESDQGLTEQSYKFKQVLLRNIQPYRPNILRFFIPKNVYQETLNSIMQAFPPLKILKIVSQGDDYILRARIATENDTPYNKLTDLYYTYRMWHVNFESIDVYSKRSVEAFYREKGGTLDRLLPRSHIKQFLFSKYCRFMDEFHQRARIAEREKTKSTEPQEPLPPLHYCGPPPI